MRYFIFDCTGTIVGNPKGYRTFKGANIQANRKGTKAHKAIVEAFYRARAANPEHQLIHRIGQHPIGGGGFKLAA